MKYRFWCNEEWEIECAVTDEDFCYYFFNAATQDRRFLNTLDAYGFDDEPEQYTDETDLVYNEDGWLIFSFHNEVRFMFKEINGAYEFAGLEIVEEELE